MRRSTLQRTDPLVMLSARVEALAGGSLDIGSFKMWFMSVEWERLMAADSDTLRLGWDIQNILYQHEDHPDNVSERVAVDEITGLWREYAAAADGVGA